jgi:tetratricopeptide (TPR) repeat protein
MVLQAVITRNLSGQEDAVEILEDVLALDPLDHWAGHEAVLCGVRDKKEFLELCRNDAQTMLDIAFDYSDAGFHDEAATLLGMHIDHPVASAAVPNPLCRTAMVLYVLAWLKKDAGMLEKARQQSPDYFFPSRLHEQVVLEWALEQSGDDPVAAYALGNYHYDLRRHEDAITVWQMAVEKGGRFATLHRNLGIALWNVRRDGTAARECYLRALELDPGDPRLVSEYDQLRNKLNDPLTDRLEFLERHMDMVLERDDCTVAYVALLNLTGNCDKALDVLKNRRFHPWEGGEGAVLRQFTTARLLLGRKALEAGDAATALDHFTGAMETPSNLGEAYHPLQAKADVNYLTGLALQALGRNSEAETHFKRSADESGDFSEMAVTSHGPLSYYRGLALGRLGKENEAALLFEELREFARSRLHETAVIDYFATSLPNLLVFEEDLQARRDAENHLLIALACHGLGDLAGAKSHLERVLAFSRTDQRAADLATVLV